MSRGLGDVYKRQIYIIRGYQVTPTHAHSMCRFNPTCSEYMIEALNEYGLFNGLKLGIKRVLRCHPFGKYGHDEIKKEGKTIWKNYF